MERNQNSKQQIRREVITKRKTLTSETILKLSEQCMNHVITLKEFQQANEVFLYVDTNGEVRTRELIQYCFDQKKIVALPKVEGKFTMNFYVISSVDELIEGYQGILEPKSEQLQLPTEHSCMIIPGVAFDKQGNRMGYGGGYYDTYCNKYPDMYRIGLCYHWQLLDEIPTEAHDIQMHQIVTDRSSSF